MDTVLAFYTFLTLMAFRAFANVVLMGNNVTLSFDCIEANFAPTVRGSGECGVLYVAQPQDACSSLKFIQQSEHEASPYVLIARGGCSFEDKVRRAQRAGFKAAIVYDNEDDGVLVAMAGNPAGIKIHAVFVSNAAGEMLKNYAGISNMELWIVPSFENSAWSIMAISLISLLAMSAVLATCFFVRRHHIGRQRSHLSHVREFHGMSSCLVKALPSLIFTSVLEDNCTSRTCAICLEDYNVGEKLRILPCNHKFHALCVDSWLTAWRTFCPICKHDAKAEADNLPASESTPLLLSTATSHSLPSQLPSMRSSFASSPAIPICISSSGLPSNPCAHSSSSTYLTQISYYGPSLQPPNVNANGNSTDLRNGSWLRSQSSHLVSPSSIGYPSISPSSRCVALYVPSPSNAPISYVGSSSSMHRPLHCSESATSFSTFTSAQSLPGC